VAVRIVGIAALLAVVALYCYYSAQRLDRLHRRIDAAAAALDSQLRRRAISVDELVGSGELPASHARTLQVLVADTRPVAALTHDREVVENALSRGLADLANHSPQLFRTPSSAAAEVHDEALRATIARRFYNDTVRDALVVRDRRVVRWLGLAGRAPHPAYFEMDDEELPAAAISVASQA
jgi:hypothetical protein